MSAHVLAAPVALVLAHAMKRSATLGLAALILLVSGQAPALTPGQIVAVGSVDCSTAINPFDFQGAIVSIDPATGDRSVLSGAISQAGGSCTTVGTGTALPNAISVAIDSNGDVLVTDSGSGDTSRVVRVSTSTGNRSVVSGCEASVQFPVSCRSAQQGSGPTLGDVFSLVVVGAQAALNLAPALKAGDLLVSGTVSSCPTLGNQSLIRIDPVTGNRTVLSGLDGTCTLVGTGDPFVSIGGLALAGDGTLWVADGDDLAGVTGRVLRVDLTTGVRTVVSGCTQIVQGTFPPAFTCTGPVAGTVLPLDEAFGIIAPNAFNAVVRILAEVTTCPTWTLLEVDPATGNQNVLSGAGATCAVVGGGTKPGAGDLGVGIEPNGNLLAGESNPGRLIRIDASTGARSVASGCTQLASGGFACDPASPIIGTGPEVADLFSPVVVPEPSASALAMAALLATLLVTRFRPASKPR